MLSLKKIKKSYGDTVILSITDLKIPSGIHWIKGENGAGKTTLFKSLTGLLPFDGDIILDENISLKLNPIPFRKLINYSEAEPVYPDFLTAKDLFRFIGKAKGAGIEHQNEISKHFEIDEYINKPCKTYSSGMLKKLSLALAFLGKPRVIVLDEPLITLDGNAQGLLFSKIKSYRTEKGTTFLISSHQHLENLPLELDNIYSVHQKTLALI